MPQINPDGTVQVSPPLASAFGPASASAPPPTMAPQQGAPAPSADPGFAGAIMALIHSIAQNVAPHSVTDIKARTDKAVDNASR